MSSGCSVPYTRLAAYKAGNASSDTRSAAESFHFPFNLISANASLPSLGLNTSLSSHGGSGSD